MPWPEHAAITGLGNEKILDNNLNPLKVISLMSSLSPDWIILRSKPPEKIPSLPLITNEPYSVGTSSKQSFTASIIIGEKTLALPSSSVIIETPSFFSIFASLVLITENLKNLHI